MFNIVFLNFYIVFIVGNILSKTEWVITLYNVQ